MISLRARQVRGDGSSIVWQRELWGAVAELHFCMYWTQKYRDEKRRAQKRHRLVGRVVNTTATQHMATYLEEVIERAVVEAISGMQEWNNTLRYSKWATSYRKGMADRIIERLAERRALKLAEARAVDTQGASTSRALTLLDVAQREEDANNDFLYGAGWSQRQRDEAAARAERQRLRQEEFTRWAAAHPEEAAAKERERREADNKWWRSNAWRYRRGGGGRSRDDNIDRSAYRAGSEAGGAVSLDGQVGQGGAGLRRIGHG